MLGGYFALPSTSPKERAVLEIRESTTFHDFPKDNEKTRIRVLEEFSRRRFSRTKLEQIRGENSRSSS